MKDRKLFERCWLCAGTLKTTQPAMVDGKGRHGTLPAGSDCPGCTDPACTTPGYMEVGLTMQQIEQWIRQARSLQGDPAVPREKRHQTLTALRERVSAALEAIEKETK